MPLKLLNRSTSSVPFAALILAGSVLASRFLGLVRDAVLASKFGAGQDLDIYFAAFRVPDLVYNVIIGGAISAAFMPVFISFFTKDESEAWHVAKSFFYIALLGLIVTCAIMFALMPLIMHLVVPGFDADTRSAAASLSRIMLLSPLFLGLSAVFSGILHSFRKFFVYSLAPIFYNIGIIIGAVWFVEYVGLEGLAWGVALGAMMHMAIQAPVSFHSGFKLFPVRNLYHPAIKRIVKLMIPRTIGLAAYQVNLWVITAIASFIGFGALSVFTFANNLHYLPIGIIGTSFATAVFPALSQLFSEDKYKKYLFELSSALRSVLFLVFPISILILVLRIYIVRVVLGFGQFDWEATRLTAAALGAFSIGIFAYALAPIVSRAFFARENTVTPVIASVIGFFVNILLSVFLIFILFPKNGVFEFLAVLLKVDDIEGAAVIGLPLAFSIGGIVTLGLLLRSFFKDKNNKAISKEIYSAFLRIIPAGLFSGGVAWLMLRAFLLFGVTELQLQTRPFLILQASFAATVAMTVYFLLAYIFNFKELQVIISYIKKKLKKVDIPQEGPIDETLR
ncbi:MAG: murein biosynthesis integral membrane protein MurJ [Candidatus Spechtbacterales bacterium]